MPRLYVTYHITASYVAVAATVVLASVGGLAYLGGLQGDATGFRVISTKQIVL